MKPRLFVGSSVENLTIAYAIQEHLEYTAEVTVWDQNIFQPSSYAIDDLLAYLDRTDFGVFVLAPDDVVIIREQTRPVVRDNIILELGLFIG